MDHRLLVYFVAVAEAGTVSAASQTLHITQPALSRQIRQLETKLRLQLFHREGNRLVLSSEGKQFLTVAHEVLQVHAQAKHTAEMLAAGAMRSVSIGAPPTTLIDIVAPFVATFSAADPIPHVSELDGGPNPSGPTDYDLFVAPQRPPANHVTLRLATLPVWAYVPATHRWGRQETVDLDLLCEETLLLVPPALKSRMILDAAMHLADVAPRGTVEVTHGRLAQALATAGRGVAVVSDDAYFDGLRPLKILDHRGETLQFHLHASWRRDHHGSTTLRHMAERLRDFCEDRYGQTLIAR